MKCATRDRKQAAPAGGAVEKKAVPLPDFGRGKYTVTLWVNTKGDGALFAKTAPKGEWVRNGKALFIRGGRLAFDVGWVGCLNGRLVALDASLQTSRTSSRRAGLRL